MKVLFFFPQAEYSYRPMYAPLGILSIASYLNANGHNAEINVDTASSAKIRKSILRSAPDMIGISVISFAYIKNAIRISKIAKELGQTVVWGGTMASAIPSQIIESGLVDYVSLREGEQTWLELAEAFDRGGVFDTIRGIVYKRNGKLCQTEPRELMDLSVLPKLDWTLVDPKRFLTPTYGCRRSMVLFWSKGCVGNCSFCYNVDFHCSERRQRKLSYVMEEMRYLVDTFGVDGFEFTDDLMFANPAQMREFCAALREYDLHVSWTAYERIGVLNRQEDYDLLYQSGCRCLMFGIETGSKTMQKVLHKPVSEERILSNVGMCHRAGIIPLPTFMLGLPGETPEDLLATVELLRKFGHFSVGINLYTPQPGTVLYDELVASGKVKPLKTLDQCAKVQWGDKQFVNISAVPEKELHTVEYYYRLKGLFFGHDTAPEKHFLDTAKNVLRAMRISGPIGFFITGFRVVYHFRRFLGLFLHPKIRKKYGLYFKETRNGSKP